MLKKFLIGTVVALALGVYLTAAAADFGTTTLRVGSKGEAVKAVQTLVGATADGSFGPMTAAKVKVWQAANGLTADGVFGPASKAKANGATTTTTTTSSTTTSTISTSGSAGDLKVTPSSKDEENKIKEGDEEKVLALKLEAEDSDIQVTNLKLELKREATNGDANASEKLADYLDSVKVYLGSKEVASVDASDFSRTSDSPDYFTKSISLKNAVVKDGDVDYLYVAAVAADSIDSDDDAATLRVTADQVRYTDGTGAIMTDDTTGSSADDYSVFGFKTSSSDDDLAIKSSSANPDDATIKVDEDKTTDDILALAFKLDNDDDSSDMDLQTIKVTADTSLDSATTAAAIEKLIDAVTLKIAGETFDADDLVDAKVSAGTATYTFDIDGDVTIDAGDVEEAKVYVSFNEQGSAGVNYDDNTSVKFAIAKTGLEAESDGDSVSLNAFSGSQTGALLTVSSSAATVSAYKWSVTNTGTILDFFFTVEADSDDYKVLSANISDSTHGNIAFASTKQLTKYSGTAEATTGGFIVSDGEKATFRVRYTLDATAGDNGKWAEATVTSVAGQTVPDDNQTSPTATVNL